MKKSLLTMIALLGLMGTGLVYAATPYAGITNSFSTSDTSVVVGVKDLISVFGVEAERDFRGTPALPSTDYVLSGTATVPVISKLSADASLGAVTHKSEWKGGLGLSWAFTKHFAFGVRAERYQVGMSLTSPASDTHSNRVSGRLTYSL